MRTKDKATPSHKLTGRFQGLAGRYRAEGHAALADACLEAADAYMTASLCAGRNFRATADRLARKAIDLGADITL